MASLAQIAGIYSFLLFGWQSAADTSWAVTLVGVVWIAIMTWICVIGIELNAATQRWLLTAEILTLALFAVVALVKVAFTDVPTAPGVSLSWLNPFHISSFNALVDGVLLGIFIYWGWDSGVAVNEESQDRHTGPGKAAVMSTILLVLIYVVVSFAAQAYGGEKLLVDNADDVLSVLGTQVFGSPLDKLLIIAVLSSAAASTQTTILPTARTSLSMARWGALPKAFGNVSPRFQTPTVSTISMGVVSIIWYVAVNELSQNVLGDSVTAIGFMIAFYYGITGLACIIYYRKAIFRSGRNFVLAGLLPLAGLRDAGLRLRPRLHRLRDQGLRGGLQLHQAVARDRDPDPHRHRRPAAGGRAHGLLLVRLSALLPAQARGRRARRPSRSRRSRPPLRWSRAARLGCWLACRSSSPFDFSSSPLGGNSAWRPRSRKPITRSRRTKPFERTTCQLKAPTEY